MDADAARSAKVHSNIATLKQRRVTTQQALDVAKYDLQATRRLVSALVAGVNRILAACKDHIRHTK